MDLKLQRGILLGDTWREAGTVISADGRRAEGLVKSGAAVPVIHRVESADAPPERQSASRATAPRQR